MTARSQSDEPAPALRISGTANEEASSSQIRGSSMLLAGQSFAVLVNLASQILVVRYLSQEAYGVFAYALSVAMITELVVAFGMRRGVARYMPLYQEEGDLARAAGTLVLAVGTVLTIGLAMILLVAAFDGTIAGSFEDDAAATTVLVVLTAMSAVGALATLLDGVLAVFARPRAIVARRFILGPLFRLIAVVLLIAAGKGVVFLALGYTVAALLGLSLYGPLLLPILREHNLTEWLRPGRFLIPAREVMRFTVPLLASDLTSVALISSGGIVLGLLAAPADVAEFRAVLPVATTMTYVLSSFGLLLVPLTARLYARSATEELNQLYWRTAAWTAVLAYPILLTCVLLADPLTVLLFGDVYEEAGSVLAVLAVGMFFLTASGHNELLLGVFRRVHFIVTANLLTVAFNIGLVLYLAPRYEAVGAAASTSISMVLLSLVTQIGLARQTDIHGIVRDVIPLYVTVIVATALTATIQFALGPPVVVSILMVIAAVAAVGAVARSQLALAETFPELARLPLVRQLVGAPD